MEVGWDKMESLVIPPTKTSYRLPLIQDMNHCGTPYALGTLNMDHL